jgi:tyrosyl-tRNA synthetase
LGHQVIFLIGDFTALIGDPSDKDKSRPQKGREEIEFNVKTYTDQAWKILDPARTEVRYNSEWLKGLDFADIIKLASNFTVSQFLQRDNFAKRFGNNDAIFLHEFFYALMQGFDAVALQNDVQIGGTDQTFNILAGRKLQEVHGQKAQIMITLPMLPGTDGTVKMSKSLGNAIGISEPPEDVYGKVMSIPDEAMPIYFNLLSRFHPSEIKGLLSELAGGQRHPRDVKMALARELTDIFHGPEAAGRAEEHFRTVFQRGERPADVPTHTVSEAIPLIDLIVNLGFASSKSEARRLMQQGGVTLDEGKVEDVNLVVTPGTRGLLRVGKRKFVELQ